MQNVWNFDGETDPIVRETVDVFARPAKDGVRFLDFRLRFQNVTNENIVFEGAKNKGYGGFCLRPDAAHKPFTFVTHDGVLDEDVFRADSPWAALFWTHAESGARSGVAIFQHPANPDYPHDGWLLRYYGFIGAAWPHEQQHRLKPREHFELQYRLVIFGGEQSRDEIADHYQSYLSTAGTPFAVKAK